jgi:hypothetical protein
MPSECVRQDEATLFGWRINKGTPHVPDWLVLAGAPRGYELGSKITIRWMVDCDDMGVPKEGTPERPCNHELLRRVSESGWEGEVLLEIDGVFSRFGCLRRTGPAYLTPLVFPPEQAGLVDTLKRIINLERQKLATIRELGASIAHKFGEW